MKWDFRDRSLSGKLEMLQNARGLQHPWFTVRCYWRMCCRRSVYFNILRVFIAILQWGLPGCACRFEQTLLGSVHKGEKYGKNPGCRKSIIQKFKIIEIAFPLKPIYNKSRKYLWRYLP